MLELITNRLNVRKRYETIAEAILKGDQTRSIVTGTPRIGKSVFLTYSLWRLVHQNKRVLFMYNPDCIYFDGQGNILLRKESPWSGDREFWTMDLWCLFHAKGKFAPDLFIIPSGLCKTIVSTSPRRDLLNDLQKVPSIKPMYMPIWSEEELRSISSTAKHKQKFLANARLAPNSSEQQ